MPYDDFNETKFVFPTSTGAVNQLGIIEVDSPKEIESIRLDIYKHGTEVGNEVFRLNIYSDSSYSNLFASSNDVALSDIPSLGAYWLGWLRFDFASFPVVGGANKYYLGLEPVTYTRVGDSFYVTAAADDPPRNINDVGLGVGGYFEIYERSVSDVCG